MSGPVGVVNIPPLDRLKDLLLVVENQEVIVGGIAEARHIGHAGHQTFDAPFIRNREQAFDPVHAHPWAADTWVC